MRWLGLFTGKTDIDFTFNVLPFGRRAQGLHKFFERCRVRKRVLKPSEKVEWLVGAEIPAVMQSPRNSRKVLHADCDVARLCFEDLATLVLGKRPPGSVLANWYECCAR